MHLVEQGFKFVIADQVRVARRHHGSDRRLGRCRGRGVQPIGIERTLAMQLIKQSFEFIVGDFIADFGGHGGRFVGHSGHRRFHRKLALVVQLVE